MTTHLSARLVWHDRGWDGHVCDNPAANACCVIQQHIRESLSNPEKLQREIDNAGLPLAQLDGWRPPCSRDPLAFSALGCTITHNDPLDFRRLPSVNEELPAYSFCTSPYRWMREENFPQLCEDERLEIRGPDEAKQAGWVFEPDRQRALLKEFWGRLEKNESLVFFYCNEGNPLGENLSRVLVGVGRITNIGSQIYFGTKKGYEDEYPVWSRCITHDHETQGFRLPYQEYLREGHDPANIICTIPDGTMLDFSYVGEHVSDDTAVGALERLLQCVQNVRDENKVTGDWDRHIAWLNDVLSEVWKNRGPFPGAGSVLQFLGVEVGTAFHRQVLMPMIKKGENAWDYLLSILQGKQKCDDKKYAKPLEQAAQRWAAYGQPKRDLLAKLVRFELTPKQVKRIADEDERIEAGINATPEELVTNPYLICEMDEGGEDRDVISLEVIDRGMRPEGDAALYLPKDEKIPQDDPRRVRGCAVTVLKNAAAEGDTLMPLGETLNLIKKQFPERRACLPDRELVIGQSDFYEEVLKFRAEAEPPTLALKILAELETEVGTRLKRRLKRKNDSPPDEWSWEELLKKEFSKSGSSKLPPEVEERARAEKAKALQVLYESRFSVLTGRAGTGKTSVLNVFLKGLKELDGQQNVLLLAPTGKARVRMMDRTGRDDAMTIHQMLMHNNWINPKNFALKYQGGEQRSAPTVIIDEASMIAMDLMGVLFRALDLNAVKRLILVGDPNQLPPIGPGRPFVDIVSWLKADQEEVEKHYPKGFQVAAKDRSRCYAHLSERARHEDHNSLALQLADVYLSDEGSAGDDEMLSRVARKDVGGDLEVHFWQDHVQLDVLLHERMTQLLRLEDGPKCYVPFNTSIGVANGRDEEHQPEKAEHWQILSPVKKHEFGTAEINRKIQGRYRGGMLNNSRRRKGKLAKPFGEQEIIWTDKVIQIFNNRRWSQPREKNGMDYVANGEVGVVTRSFKNKGKADTIGVVFSTQPKVMYYYKRGEVDANLELAYAMTVHKSQGSDFEIVFLVLPAKASTLSKELLYTGLTRFKKKLVLLVERDTGVLERLRKPSESDTLLRNTNLLLAAVRPEDVNKWYANHLMHRTATGVPVRSKSEVIVGDTMTRLDISYKYEEKLLCKSGNPNDYRLPDFTVSFEGDVFYWEHLGMLSVPSYKEKWERKEQWYKDNGYFDQLITSEDKPDGSISSTEIESIARKHILMEDDE